MKTLTSMIITVMFAVSPTGSSPDVNKCGDGMVQSGSTCVDRYEASLWKITDERCASLVRDGKSLTATCLAGALQLGVSGTDYVDAQCQFNGAGNS